MSKKNEWRGNLRFLLSLFALAVIFLPSSSYAETVEYVHTDMLGTPIAVTDANGSLIETSEYEPYGRLLNRPVIDQPGFTGHAQDAATGLTYMQQRYYDPIIGRFLSVDPIAVNPVSGENFNRYWYGANNPYSNMDPDGRYICTAKAQQCKAVASALNKIRISSLKQTGSHIAGGRSAEIAKFYGKEGQDNGVTVQAGAPNNAGNAKTVGSDTTISINFDGLAGAAGKFKGFSYQNLVDSTVLHEGSHGYDQKMRFENGFSAMTRSEHQYLQGERRAYRAEAAFYESLRENSPWGLWTIGRGRDNAEIERQSIESVKYTCASGRCAP